MRLRLESPGAAPYWLVGNPALNERTGMSRALDDQLQVTRQQQAVPGAGYWAKEFFDRGNQAVKFDATASREFYDEIERMDFLSRLAAVDADRAEHSWEGRVCVREQVGTRYREWPLEGAVVSLTGTALEGQTRVRLRYQVQAPGFGPPVNGVLGISIQAVAMSPASLGFGSWAGIWLSNNTEGDFIQVSLANADDPGIDELYQFEVDTGGGVTPGRIAISQGDNFGEIAAWMIANTDINAEVIGGDLVLKSPARDGDIIYLYSETLSGVELFSDFAGPVESSVVELTDSLGRTVIAETRPVTFY